MSERTIRVNKFIFISILLLSYSLHASAVLVNINTATLEELDSLPGVGPAVAQSIISNRPYATASEISRADGIGEPGSSSYNNIINLITVDDVGGVDVSPEQDDQEETATTTTSTNNQNSSQTQSSHYSSALLIINRPEISVVFGAGRDRVGAVGSPMEFKAETENVSERRNSFLWNFGDGTVGEGMTVSHSYEYAGDYVVVLEATLPEGAVVSRANVKIIEPDLHVTSADSEKIELANDSPQEVNLFGRALYANGKAFVFPKDTIIKRGVKISFSSNTTRLDPASSSDVGLIVIGEMHTELEVRNKIDEYLAKQQIAQLENQIALLRQNLPVRNIKLESVEEGVIDAEDVEDQNLPEATANALSSMPQESVSKTRWMDVVKQFLFWRAD